MLNKLDNYNILSWNLNSIRVRWPRLLFFIKLYNPDIVCLQEVRGSDNQNLFFCQLEKIGYKYIENPPHHDSMKGMGGVAVIVRVEYSWQTVGVRYFHYQDFLNRTICGLLNHQVLICNVYYHACSRKVDYLWRYVKNHKIRLMIRVRNYLRKFILNDWPVILLGDFNVIRSRQDTTSISFHNRKIMCSSIERLGMKHCCQWLTPVLKEGDGRATWVSYITPSLRYLIDNCYLGPGLSVIHAYVLKGSRWLSRPSDHCPLKLKISIG